MGSYQTTWVSYEEAIAGAPDKKSGILIYFSPEGQTTDHSLFGTPMLRDLSRERPCVKIPYSEDQPLRQSMKIPSAATIVVADWFGNPIKWYWVRRFSDRFPWKDIQAGMEEMPEITKKLEKNLKKRLRKGERDLERERYRSAIEALQYVVKYEGYETQTPAEKGLERALKAGEALVEEAVDAAEANRKKAASALKKLLREFKGTRVEKAARDALEGIGEKARQVESANAPTEAAPDLLDGIAEIISERAREISDLPERVGAAIHRGRDAEMAGRYEEALREYEAAVSLDPRDPVAHRFLGELFRHHLGDWERARQQFEEVVRLGGDPYSVAVALHGIGKMTIASGEEEAGLRLIEESIGVRPTPLAYRNLAVYWNSEGETERANRYVKEALELEPDDPYNAVFAAVYLAHDGKAGEARRVLGESPLDPSMHYNIACIYAELGEKERALSHLRKHFYEFERFDAVRRHEMREARSDINFRSLRDDAAFIAITSLADE